MKRIALITSGGNAPGMNACIRAIVKTCLGKGILPVGYLDGYNGMMNNRFKEMSSDDVMNIIQRGGGPSAYDRILPTRMGVFAVYSLLNGENKMVIGSNGDSLHLTSISEAVQRQSIPNLKDLKIIRALKTVI